MTIPELASLLGVTSLNLYLAQTHDDAFGSIRDSVAVFFGFTCWSELLTQARMDEAREIRHVNGAGRRRLLYIETDNRPNCEREPGMVLNRQMFYSEKRKSEIELWLFDERYYVCRSLEYFLPAGMTVKKASRVQRFNFADAEEEYRNAVKELS
jgi:hypothetical protein